MLGNKKQAHYYQVDLELWSKSTERSFTFVNISHIPYKKLEEIFKSQITDEQYLFDNVAGYQIDSNLFQKHKEYLTNNILCEFDFNSFDYWVSLSGDKIEKLKRSYYSEWPPK